MYNYPRMQEFDVASPVKVTSGAHRLSVHFTPEEKSLKPDFFTGDVTLFIDDEKVGDLNRYLSGMVTIIKKYGGTIDEFIGDAVFVIFGVPAWHDDDAQRAAACAVEMQLAIMAAINEKNRLDGLPDVEMGIGLHTGQVIVGNIDQRNV